MARARGLTKADQQLWAAFTQTIIPLPGKSRPYLEPAPPAPAPREPTEVVQTARPKAKSAAKPLHPESQPGGIDKSTWQNFATGKRRPEQKLDLHGHTATRAHHATTAFIHQSYRDGLRCIEIVTGKGEILSRELPHWLNAPTIRPLILALAHAPTKNTGAVRILLRRTR
jgi:DNA-nicking Smr family endonuclease